MNKWMLLPAVSTQKCRKQLVKEPCGMLKGNDSTCFLCHPTSTRINTILKRKINIFPGFHLVTCELLCILTSGLKTQTKHFKLAMSMLLIL